MTDDLVHAVEDAILEAARADKSWYDVAQAAITAYVAAIEAQGLRIVPVEPTDRMIDAGHEKVICPAYVNAELCEAEDVWSAMLTAAPKHTVLSPRDERAVTDNGWQSMPSTETPGVFPFNGRRVLVGWNDISALPMHVELGFWRSGTGKGSGWCNTYGHSFGGSPTHWMPLPDAPKDRGEAPNNTPKVRG